MKIRKILWSLAGLVSFCLGTIGTFMPIIPTVPLYLLATFCFASSSKKMQDWFERTRLYKRHLLPYLNAGGLTFKAKSILIIFVTIQIVIAGFIVGENVIGMIVLATLYMGFLLSMIFVVKTISEENIINEIELINCDNM